MKNLRRFHYQKCHLSRGAVLPHHRECIAILGKRSGRIEKARPRCTHHRLLRAQNDRRLIGTDTP